MNVNELKEVVEKANDILKKLKEKYHNLDGYLVFSSTYGQCELTTNVAAILKFFPLMIVDSKQKVKGLQLWQKINDIEAENKKNFGNLKSSEKFRHQLDDIVKNIEVDEDTFVEIRFKGTDYDMIFALQKDELISKEHTPQTKASIRIVLGTIKDLQ